MQKPFKIHMHASRLIKKKEQDGQVSTTWMDFQNPRLNLLACVKKLFDVGRAGRLPSCQNHIHFLPKVNFNFPILKTYRTSNQSVIFLSILESFQSCRNQ